MKIALLFLSVFSLLLSQAQTVVKKEGYFGLMDSEMHFLLDPVFTELTPIAPSTYYAKNAYFGRKGNEKWLYFIDDSVFIAEQIDTFELVAYKNYISFQKDGLKGLLCIGKNPNAAKYEIYWFEKTHLIAAEYQAIRFFDDMRPIAQVRKNNKFGVLDAEKNELLVPCIFETRLGRRSFNSNQTYYFAEATSNSDLDSLYIPSCKRVFSFPNYSNFNGTQRRDILMYYGVYLPNNLGHIQLINIRSGEIELDFEYYSKKSHTYSQADVRLLNDRLIAYVIYAKDEKGQDYYRYLFIDVETTKMLYEVTSAKLNGVYISGTGIYLSNYPNQLLKKNKIGEISEFGTVLWLSK